MYESRGKTEVGTTFELLRSEVLKDVATNQQGQDNEREDEVLPVGNENEEIAEHSYLMIIGNSNGNEENQAYDYANNSAAHLNNDEERRNISSSTQQEDGTEKLYFVNLGDNHHQMQENGSPKIYYLMMVGDLPAQVSTTVADVEKVTEIHPSIPCRMRDCTKRFFHKRVYKKHKKRHIKQNQLMWNHSGISTAPGNVNKKKNHGVSVQDEKINDAESKHEEDDDVITDESNDSDVSYEGSQKSSTLKVKYPEDNTTDERDFSDCDNDEECDDSGGNEEAAKKLSARVLVDNMFDKDGEDLGDDDANFENVFSEAEIAEVTQSATCVSGAREYHQSMITETQVLSRTNSVPPTPHHSRTNPFTQCDSAHTRSRSKARNEIFSNQESSLNVHAKTRKGEKVRVEPLPFKCEICARKFRFKFSYNRHREIVHEPPKHPETCPFCTKVFDRKEYLTRHIVQVHISRSQWKFECQIKGCERTFPTQSQLKMHMNVHELSNKLPCPTCLNMFKSEQYLKEHIKQFHTEGLEPKWKCSINGCDKRFRFESQLKKHLQTHTHQKLFMCDYCGKCFGWRHSLKNHAEKKICGPSAVGISSE